MGRELSELTLRAQYRQINVSVLHYIEIKGRGSVEVVCGRVTG